VSEQRRASAMFSRRTFVGTLASGVAGALIAACASPAPAPTATSAPAANPTAVPAAAPTTAAKASPSKELGTVKFRSWWSPSNSQPMSDWDAYIQKTFPEKNAGAKLVIEYVPFADYFKKFLTSVAANDVPDVLHSSISWGRDFYDLDTLVDLNDYMKVTPDLDPKGQIPVTTIYNQKAGKFYGASWEGPDGRCMLYNVDLFKQAGIDPDPAKVKKWTWDDLIANAQKLTKRTGEQIDVAGYLVWVLSQDHLAGWLYTIDGKFYADDAMTTVAFADGDNKAAQVMQLNLDLLNKYKVSLPISAERQDESLFYQGKAAIAQGLLFAVGRYKAQAPAELKWDYAPWPQGPGGKGQSGAAFANMHTIPKVAKNKDGGWQFISWYCSLESALAKLKIQGMLSTRKDFYETKEWKEEVVKTPQLARVQEIADVGGPVPFVRRNRTGVIADPIFQAVFLGKSEPKAAMVELQQKYNDILSKPPEA
jgi:multiple sugar transport system substrate-binding protein